MESETKDMEGRKKVRREGRDQSAATGKAEGGRQEKTEGKKDKAK